MNKKKQKNFDLLRALAPIVAKPAGIKSFLLLFFKKEALSSAQNFLLVPAIAAEQHVERKAAGVVETVHALQAVVGQQYLRG